MSKSFRTRKRGTPRQIGKKFPVLEKKKLPPKISIDVDARYEVPNYRKRLAHGAIARFIKDPDTGEPWVRISKGRKWFSMEWDAADEEITDAMRNFNREWKARVGQYIEDE